jgi:hypothetical protein
MGNRKSAYSRILVRKAVVSSDPWLRRAASEAGFPDSRTLSKSRRLIFPIPDSRL